MSEWIRAIAQLSKPYEIVLGWGDFSYNHDPESRDLTFVLCFLDPCEGWQAWPGLDDAVIFYWHPITCPQQKVHFSDDEDGDDLPENPQDN